MDGQWVAATATAVNNKPLRRKSDNREFTLYEVETDQGTYATAKRDLAEEAFRLLNKPAMFCITTQVNGNFTNHYLEAVEPAPNGSHKAPEGTFKTPGAFGSKPFGESAQKESASFTPAERTLPEPGVRTVTENDRMIFRQVAAKVAAHISQTAADFWMNLDDLVEYFATGTKPNQPDEADGIPF